MTILTQESIKLIIRKSEGALAASFFGIRERAAKLSLKRSTHDCISVKREEKCNIPKI